MKIHLTTKSPSNNIGNLHDNNKKLSNLIYNRNDRINRNSIINIFENSFRTSIELQFIQTYFDKKTQNSF